MRKEGNYRRKLAQNFENMKKEGSEVISNNDPGFKYQRIKEKTMNSKYSKLKQVMIGLNMNSRLKAEDFRKAG